MLGLGVFAPPTQRPQQHGPIRSFKCIEIESTYNLFSFQNSIYRLDVAHIKSTLSFYMFGIG